MTATGGLTFNLTRLAIASKRAGKVIMIASVPWEEEYGLFDELSREGIRSYKIPKTEKFSLKNTINSIRIVHEIIDRKDIDVVHVNCLRHLVVAFLASKVFSRRRASIVVSIHSTLHGTSYQNLALLFGNALLNICADLIMPVAEVIRKEMIRFGLLGRKAFTLYNGVDLDFFDRCTRAQHGKHPSSSLARANHSQVLIGCVAYLVPRKGHRYLIDAFYQVLKHCPDVKLLIVGDGPLRSQLVGQVRELGLEENVIFTGRVKYMHLYQLLHQVNIYAFPSLSELFPFAILEAMAAGKPIVTTNVGGICEAIEDRKSGLLVPAGESAELARCIEFFIRNPVEAKKMGVAARKRVEKMFDLKKTVEDLAHYYKSVSCP